MSDRHLSREELYAFSDGVLPASEQRAVKQHLVTCAECQTQFERSAAVVHSLKQHLGETRAPASLRAAIREQVAAQEPRKTAVSRFLAHGLALALGATIGLFLLAVLVSIVFQDKGAQPVVAQLAESHLQLAHDRGLVQMQGNALELSNWFGDQIHGPIQVPAPEEFSIVGARTVRVDNQPVAQILYRQGVNTEMSLFIWRGVFRSGDLQPREVGGGRFYVGTQNGESVVFWNEHDLSYACVGEASPEAALNVAARVWKSDDN